MENNVVDPLAYADDADQTVLEEIARLDGLRVRPRKEAKLRSMLIMHKKDTTQQDIRT